MTDSATATDQPGNRSLSNVRVFLLVALPLAAVFLATANWSSSYNLDAFTNVQTGYEFGRHGSPFLPEEADIGGLWSVPVGDSYVSHYPPGAALHIAPLFAVWPANAEVKALIVSGEPRNLRIPPLGPAAIVSAIVSAIAMGLVAVASNRLVDSRIAVAGAVTLGLGTATWAVASHQLWQHGPAMLWIAAGTVLSIRTPLSSGLAFGVAALVRPHTALVGFSVAASRWIEDRKLWPAAGIAGGTLLGLVAVVTYNKWLFGGASISGGYGDAFAARLVSFDNVGWFVGNVIGALTDPVRGLLIFSPFLLILIPGLPAAWRDSPWWARGAAVGGLLYILVQLKANRFSGGGNFFSYRYPLEFLVAATPLLTLAYVSWVERRARLRRVFLMLVGYSMVLQAYGVIFAAI